MRIGASYVPFKLKFGELGIKIQLSPKGSIHILSEEELKKLCERIIKTKNKSEVAREIITTFVRGLRILKKWKKEDIEWENKFIKY